MSVHASIKLSTDQSYAQCLPGVAGRTPILVIVDRHGYSISVSIDQDLPTARQIDLADELMHATVEFAEAMRAHHGGVT